MTKAKVQTFRIKPREVTEILEYVHYDGTNNDEIVEWVESFGLKAVVAYDMQGTRYLFIQNGTYDDEDYNLVAVNSWVHCYYQDNDNGDASSYTQTDDNMKSHFDEVE